MAELKMQGEHEGVLLCDLELASVTFVFASRKLQTPRRSAKLVQPQSLT